MRLCTQYVNYEDSFGFDEILLHDDGFHIGFYEIYAELQVQHIKI